MLRTSSLAALALFVCVRASALEVGPEFAVAGSSLGARSGTFDGIRSDERDRIAIARTPTGYVAAWNGAGGGLYATRIGEYGETGTPIRISSDGQYPSLACGSDNCLAVWRTDYGPVEADGTVHPAIVAARLTHGLELIDTSPISIARISDYDTTNSERANWWVANTQVATDGSTYLVTHVGQQGTICAAIWQTGVSTDGTPAPIGVAAVECDYSNLPEWSTAYAGRYFAAYQYWDEIGPIYGNCPSPEAVASVTYSGFYNMSTRTSGDAPIAIASNGASSLLVLFNSCDQDPYSYSTTATLRAAWIGPATAGYVAASDTALLQQAGYGDYRVVGTFDGKDYVAVWWTSPTSATEVLGAVLPATLTTGSIEKTLLFSTPTAEAAIASSGEGVSLLLYTSPSSSDPSVDDIKGRLVFSDSTAPAVTVPDPIAVTATSSGGAVVTFSARATDDYSGTLTPTCAPVSGSRLAPGTTRVTCFATDAAGNVGTASFDVTVTFSWSGFLSPLNSDGATFKASRSIPVKFALTGASSSITDLKPVLTVAPVATLSAQRGRDKVVYFRYSKGQYVATTSLGVGTWTIRANLGDGVDRSVSVIVAKK